MTPSRSWAVVVCHRRLRSSSREVLQSDEGVTYSTILLTWTHLSTAGDAKIHRVSDPAAMRRGYLLGQLCEEQAGTGLVRAAALVVRRGGRERSCRRSQRDPARDGHPDGHPASAYGPGQGLDERGIVFYTNQESAKARDLANRLYAAAVFAWLPLERQVRLAGPVLSIVTRAGLRRTSPAGPADRKSGRGRHRSPRVVASRAGARREGPGGRGTIRRRRRSCATVLGRLPAQPGRGRVLAGPHRPDA